MSEKKAISIRTAAVDDKPLLLEMNRHLMEDERFDRPLGDEALSRRWDEFLSLDRYGVYLFRATESDADADFRTVGYAVVHLDDEPRYLRHFYIRREERRHGFGTTAFHSLLEYLDVTKMDLDVMSWNDRGMGFWKSLGFRERCRVMEYDAASSH